MYRLKEVEEHWHYHTTLKTLSPANSVCKARDPSSANANAVGKQGVLWLGNTAQLIWTYTEQKAKKLTPPSEEIGLSEAEGRASKWRVRNGRQ